MTACHHNSQTATCKTNPAGAVVGQQATITGSSRTESEILAAVAIELTVLCCMVTEHGIGDFADCRMTYVNYSNPTVPHREKDVTFQL